MSGTCLNLTVDNLFALIAAGTPPTILDVRANDEYRVGHIAGAPDIPGDPPATRLGEIPRDRPVVAD
jgi:rhodanese-related sulfurtransferase